MFCSDLGCVGVWVVVQFGSIIARIVVAVVVV